MAASDSGGVALTLAPSGVTVLQVLLAMAVVVLVGRLLAPLLTRAGQPPVMAEILAGIALGPSLLGAVSPAASAFLLPAAAVPALGALAQCGVVLYMFDVGLDARLDELRSRLGAVAAVAAGALLAPLAVGAALAWHLAPDWAPAGVPPRVFVSFIAVALSVTAFPVLARILTDLGLSRTPLGSTALASAAVADVAGWALLALVIGLARGAIGSALGTLIATGGFVGVLLAVVRPTLDRRLRTAIPSSGILVATLAGLGLSASLTHLIGIHALFGAFLFGVILPHDSAVTLRLRTWMARPVALLLPAFFALTGLHTEVGSLGGLPALAACALIIAAASLGKIGGTAGAARAVGFAWREAASLGVLMNTRGLMEVIVLGIGLEQGFISPAIFTMMVVMALVTTMATAPLLRALGLSARPVA